MYISVIEWSYELVIYIDERFSKDQTISLPLVTVIIRCLCVVLEPVIGPVLAHLALVARVCSATSVGVLYRPLHGTLDKVRYPIVLAYFLNSSHVKINFEDNHCKVRP